MVESFSLVTRAILGFVYSCQNSQQKYKSNPFCFIIWEYQYQAVRNNKINIPDYEIIWILVSSEKTITTQYTIQIVTRGLCQNTFTRTLLTF